MTLILMTLELFREFVAFLESQVDVAIYIWGGEGAVASVAYIKAHESGIDETRALALYQERLAAGIDPSIILVWDCSGLSTEWLIAHHIIAGDMNANGLLKRCRMIDKADVVPGCFTFRVVDTDKDGKNEQSDRGHHVGVCTAMVNGVPRIVHAKGRAYGVVGEGINDSGSGYWELFGVPDFMEPVIQQNESEGEIMIKAGQRDVDKPGVVYLFQHACLSAGRKVLQEGKQWADMVLLEGEPKKPVINGCDGVMGPWMQSLVKAIQAKYGLPQTGEVDGLTYGYLASEIPVEDAAKLNDLNAALNAAKAKIAKAEPHIEAAKAALSEEIS